MERIPRVAVMFSTMSLCFVLSLFFCAGAMAQQKKPTDLEGVKYEAAVSFADNLKAFAGRDITVNLKSGKILQGVVKWVGNGLLHLEKIAGKEFYDALIKIEDISAIEARFRELK